MRKLKSPHPVDIHVGRRVRIRRVECGMSQSMLAEQFGLTFQQLQKYESGSNRISASRLWQIAQILDVPVAWFFEGLDGESAAAVVAPSTDVLEIANTVLALPTEIRMTVQKALAALADSMTADESQETK